MTAAEKTVTFLDDVTVQLVQHCASDDVVVKAALVSTVGAGSLEEVSDAKRSGLIKYLMKNRHGSPYEHTSITVFIEAPLFVAREHMRHRAGCSYNETSGRYRELEPRFYIPGPDRKLVQIGKTGAYEFVRGTAEDGQLVGEQTAAVYTAAWQAYQNMIQAGIAKEVARLTLPVGLMTTYWFTCNARSLMHFLSLRTEHADASFPSKPQREIAMVADKLEEIFAELMPLTYQAFVDNGRVAP